MGMQSNDIFRDYICSDDVLWRSGFVGTNICREISQKRHQNAMAPTSGAGYCEPLPMLVMKNTGYTLIIYV
jgi:hypothetical protein